MQVSEQFALVLRRVLMCALFVSAGLILAGRAEGQTGGTVGIYAVSTPAFVPAATGNVCSKIFPDNGQGQNTLFFATTGFAGTVDLEWQPQGQSTFYVITQATYPSSDTSNSHTLQFGGYFPNIRSCITNYIGGSLTGWYNATSGPVPSVLSGVGSNGSASPIVCDHNSVSVTLANGDTRSLLAGPINAGDKVVLCSFMISFAGATAAGSWSMIATSDFNCSSGATVLVTGDTTAGTPQTLILPMMVKTQNSNFAFPCLVNNSGASLVISASYASVRGV